MPLLDADDGRNKPWLTITFLRTIIQVPVNGPIESLDQIIKLETNPNFSNKQEINELERSKITLLVGRNNNS